MHRSIRCTLVITALLFFSCSGPEIGDHCATNEDCPNTCQTGGGFPNGICTHECDRSDQCPQGWVCISDSSGICMPTCHDEAACADAFGHGWTCRDKSLQDGSGSANVCFGQ